MRLKIFLVLTFVVLQNSLYSQKKRELENRNAALNAKIKELENQVIESKAKLLTDSKAILNLEKGVKDLVGENRELRIENERLKIRVEYLEKDNAEQRILVKSIQSELGKSSYKPPQELNIAGPTYQSFNNTQNTSSSYRKTSKSSRKYYLGPRGGCYYINSNGNKTYVDRSLCN